MQFLISMPGTSEWILILVGIFLVALPIWAIVDIVQSNFRDPDHKVLWVLAVVFMPLLGSIIYYYLGKNYKAS